MSNIEYKLLMKKEDDLESGFLGVKDWENILNKSYIDLSSIVTIYNNFLKKIKNTIPSLIELPQIDISKYKTNLFIDNKWEEETWILTPEIINNYTNNINNLENYYMNLVQTINNSINILIEGEDSEYFPSETFEEDVKWIELNQIIPEITNFKYFDSTKKSFVNGDFLLKIDNFLKEINEHINFDTLNNKYKILEDWFIYFCDKNTDSNEILLRDINPIDTYGIINYREISSYTASKNFSFSTPLKNIKEIYFPSTYNSRGAGALYKWGLCGGDNYSTIIIPNTIFSITYTVFYTDDTSQSFIREFSSDTGQSNIMGGSFKINSKKELKSFSIQYSMSFPKTMINWYRGGIVFYTNGKYRMGSTGWFSVLGNKPYITHF